MEQEIAGDGFSGTTLPRGSSPAYLTLSTLETDALVSLGHHHVLTIVAHAGVERP